MQFNEIVMAEISAARILATQALIEIGRQQDDQKQYFESLRNSLSEAVAAMETLHGFQIADVRDCTRATVDRALQQIEET